MKQRREQIIAAIIVILVIITLYAAPGIIEKSKDIVIYKRALPYYKNGQYDEAIEILDPYSRYENQRCMALLYLCYATKEYRSGDIKTAHDHIWEYNYYRHRTKGVIDVNNEAFVWNLNEAYGKIIQEEEAAEKAAYEQKIKDGVPFEGMPESRIDDTSLGKHAGIRYNTEMKNGKCLEANIYVFKRDGDIILEARCLEGKVTQVWDYRDGKSSSPYSKKNRSTYKAPKKQEDDPYNVNDFYDAEDFYDEYYDDFFDYEDAEDYFNDHHE